MATNRDDTRDREREYERQRDAYDDSWRSWLRGSSSYIDRYGTLVSPRDDSGDSHERGED